MINIILGKTYTTFISKVDTLFVGVSFKYFFISNIHKEKY